MTFMCARGVNFLLRFIYTREDCLILRSYVKREITCPEIKQFQKYDINNISISVQVDNKTYQIDYA